MNLAGMNSITRMEVPNITREAQNLRRVSKCHFLHLFLTPSHVPWYAQMNHLLDWVEIRVVQIPTSKLLHQPY